MLTTIAPVLDPAAQLQLAGQLVSYGVLALGSVLVLLGSVRLVIACRNHRRPI